MSSPFNIFSHMDSSTTFASTFTAFTDDTSPPADMELSSEDLTLRRMNLKVLYSFDEGKTNCLARYPHALDIRTAALDETKEIGIVELKTCIQAVANASPELVARLGQDYTIYAYDYSEYDTPLVGQGMLSWALASASSTPNAPAHKSSTIVTGEVRRNIMGIFSKGAHETLEVKLRLVPVPTIMQSEYLSSMQRYREMSNVLPDGFDPQAWTTFAQANPTFFAGSSRPPLQRSTSTPLDTSSMGMVQHLLRNNSSPRETTGIAPTVLPNQQMQARNNRASTPVTNQAAIPPQMIVDFQASRPNSRASARGSIQPQIRPSTKRKGSVSTGYASTDEGPEEGPAKKRARVVKADWPVSNTLEKQPDSLRVAAGNAASVRNLYQPVATKPARFPTASNNTNEEPVRPPTPIAKTAPQKNRRPRPAASNLRRESLSQETHAYVSPYQMPLSEPILTDSGLHGSPERSLYGGSFSNTPANIPSSPPVYGDLTSAPGTPALPPVRRDHQDSGFMSETILFDDYNFHPLEGGEWNPELQNDGAADIAPFPEFPPELKLAAQPVKEHRTQTKLGKFKEQMPGRPEILPQTLPPRTFNHITRHNLQSDASSPPPSDVFPEHPQHDLGHVLELPASLSAPVSATESLQPHAVAPAQAPAHSRPNSRPPSQAGHRPEMPPPVAPANQGHPLTRAQSVGSIALPPVAASDPVRPQPSLLHRSQTWAEESQHPASDAPASSMEAKTRTVSRSGAKRLQQIRANLDKCVENGQLPPFCENCGAIETPTWRKAYGRVYEDGFDNVRVSDEDGGVVCCEPLETDSTGKVTRFKVFKKFGVKGVTDPQQEGYDLILLCNPCGLYFFKNKKMRPEEKWVKKPRDPNPPKRKRGPRKRPSKKNPNNDQAVSDGQAMQDSTAVTDASSPMEAAEDAEEEFEDEEPEVPSSKRQRAQSAEPSKSFEHSDQRWMNQEEANAELRKAIQASPARGMGSAICPIPLDESPSARRVLFPSPRRESEMRTLDNASLMTSPTQLRRSPRHGATLRILGNKSPSALRRSPRSGDKLYASDDGSPTARRRSPRLNKQYMMPELRATDKNKENQPPAPEKDDDGHDDGLGHLFDDDDDDDEFMERPTTPTPSSRSSQRNRFETPSPAAKAARFVITSGQKSIHVKQVMELMDEPAAGSPLEARNASQVLDIKKHILSPKSSAIAQTLQAHIRSHDYAQTPSKPRSNRSSSHDTPDSQPADPSTFDLSQIEDLGPDFADGSHLFDDEEMEFTLFQGTAEEEQQRIDELMGDA